MKIKLCEHYCNVKFYLFLFLIVILIAFKSSQKNHYSNLSIVCICLDFILYS